MMMSHLPQNVGRAEMHHLSAMMTMVLPLALLLLLMLGPVWKSPSWPHLLLDGQDTIRKCPYQDPDPLRS